MEVSNVKGNRTNVPKSVNGHNADTSNLDEFHPPDKVITQIDKFDGIGIALTGGITAIDIDHCIQGWELISYGTESHRKG